MEKSVEKPRTGATIRSPKVVERRSRIRDELVDTGARLFAEKGVDQVSVEEIIEAVGVSRRTFYGFFANKYELAASALVPVLENGMSDLRRLSRAPARDIVPGIIDFYLAQWEANPNALKIISDVGRDVLPYLESAHVEFGNMVKKLLRRAESGGALRNGRADDTFKVISRTAVPLLKVYADHPKLAEVYRESMLALLARPDHGDGQRR
jgi:AcrR family transcriptional regulator